MSVAGPDGPASAGLDRAIDGYLAALLRGEHPALPPTITQADPAGERLAARTLYNGLAGLLAETPADWPPAAAAAATVRNQAVAMGMWEIRHRQIVVPLLEALAARGIVAVLLKGTALAYDLYSNPAMRARGDTDLLIAPADLPLARTVLAEHGFVCPGGGEGPFGNLHAQECWVQRRDRADHVIDLHWQLMNSAFLEARLNAADCLADPLPLPRLTPVARMVNRAAMLAHLVLHRSVHIANPYYMDGETHYGADRLIWMEDIFRVAQTLTETDWEAFAALAGRRGLGRLCADALDHCATVRGPAAPAAIMAKLRAHAPDPALTAYLHNAGQAGRAWQDLRATPGMAARLRFVLAQALPSRAIIEDRYPELAGRPLPLLHARRLAGIVAALVRPRARAA